MTVWGVIPAAGVGARMGTECPKQYLSVDGQPLLTRTVAALGRDARLRGVVVSVSSTDERWPQLRSSVPGVVGTAMGGSDRSASVLAGLELLAGALGAAATDLVAVHDAARPCLLPEDLSAVLDAAAEAGVDGAVLAQRMSDTVKRGGGDGLVRETVPRESLWRAQTPQVFRLGALLAALRSAAAEGVAVTDEAQAMERRGARVRLVEARGANIKLTVPADLALVAALLGAPAPAVGNGGAASRRV